MSAHRDPDSAHAESPADSVHAGDWLEVEPPGGGPPQRGQIVEVLGAPGHLRYRVRWDEDRVTIHYPDRAVGVLNVFDRAGGQQDFAAEDERLLEGFAASAATAVATAQTVASEGLRRSIEASERERQRWALELHDETLQELAGLKVMLSGALRDGDLPSVHATIVATIEQIDTEITGLRRLINDLRPAALDTFGAKAALEGLAERITTTSGLEIELQVDLAYESGRSAQRPPPVLENAM